MYIPKQVKFMGHTYRVKQEIEQTANGGHWAQLDHTNHEFRIYRNMDDDQKGEAFMHEGVHLVCDKLGVDIDEDDIIRIGAGFFAILNENKLLKESPAAAKKKRRNRKKKVIGFGTSGS